MRLGIVTWRALAAPIIAALLACALGQATLAATKDRLAVETMIKRVETPLAAIPAGHPTLDQVMKRGEGKLRITPILSPFASLLFWGSVLVGGAMMVALKRRNRLPLGLAIFTAIGVGWILISDALTAQLSERRWFDVVRESMSDWGNLALSAVIWGVVTFLGLGIGWLTRPGTRLGRPFELVVRHRGPVIATMAILATMLWIWAELRVAGMAQEAACWQSKYEDRRAAASTTDDWDCKRVSPLVQPGAF